MKTNDEKMILQEFEKGNFSSIAELKKGKQKYHDEAKYTLSKSKTINIRITEKDLKKIRAIAVSQGLPYQTFISHVLHRISN